MTDQIKEKMIELREQGLGYRRIAQEVGLNVGSVTIFFRRLIEKNAATFCRYCGKKLKQSKGHRQKKYCDARCRYLWLKAHPEEQDLRAYRVIICANCGCEYKTYGSKERRYCSRQCYLLAHAKKE